METRRESRSRSLAGPPAMANDNDGPILIISGTNRPGSNALKVARALAEHYARTQVASDLLDLQQLPREIFDGSAYQNKPPAMIELQRRVLVASGLHVVTPE